MSNESITIKKNKETDAISSSFEVIVGTNKHIAEIAIASKESVIKYFALFLLIVIINKMFIYFVANQIKIDIKIVFC